MYNDSLGGQVRDRKRIESKEDRKARRKRAKEASKK